MQLHPYVSFNGQCETAFKFYERVLGGKITSISKWGESPMAEQLPPELSGWVMHATIQIGDGVLMGADPPPEHYQQPKGISVTLNVKTTSEGERIFQALAEKGSTQMPFQKTFWAPGFGMCVDQFGIPWMVNCEQEG